MTAKNIPIQIATGQGILDVLYRFLNPIRKYYVGSPKLNSSPFPIDMLQNPEGYDCENISKNAGFSTVQRNKKGWKLNYNDTTYHYQATSLSSRPDSYFPGILQQALGQSSLENMICINFTVTSPLTQWSRLKVRDQLLGTKERMNLGNPKVRAQQRHDLEQVQNLTSPENISTREAMIDASVHIITMGEDEEEVEKLAAKHQRMFTNRGHHETTRGDAIIHSCIPFNFRHETHKLLKRDVPYMSSGLADMAPLYTTYQGVAEPKILLNNRDGSPIFVDLWNSNVVTGHSLIAGTTGSGKSFTFNNFLMACVAKYRPKIWIVDKGRSYETLTKVVDGNFIELVQQTTSDEFGEDLVPTCLNPLFTDLGSDGNRRMPEPDELTYILSLLTSMIKSAGKMGADDVSISSKYVNLIYKSLESFFSESYAANPKQELTMSDYVVHLKQQTFQGVSGVEVAEALTMYHGNGAFAALFDGFLDVDWDNNFTVLETGRMSNSPCLSVVLLALFRQIDTYSKFKLSKKQKKIIAIDEAWSVLSDSVAASALGSFYRELRKYNGACLLISQTINDFLKLVNSEGSGAEDGILANTSHYFLLACSQSDYDIAKEHLSFTDEEVAEWRSLASCPPYYGEIFYRMKTKANTYYSGIVRLWPTPIQRWVATTDGDDVDMREKLTRDLVNKGLTPNKARLETVISLSKERPHGANYAKVA
jgi:hypothetical protein